MGADAGTTHERGPELRSVLKGAGLILLASVAMIGCGDSDPTPAADVEVTETQSLDSAARMPVASSAADSGLSVEFDPAQGSVGETIVFTGAYSGDRLCGMVKFQFETVELGPPPLLIALNDDNRFSGTFVVPDQDPFALGVGPINVIVTCTDDPDARGEAVFEKTG